MTRITLGVGDGPDWFCMGGGKSRACDIRDSSRYVAFHQIPNPKNTHAWYNSPLQDMVPNLGPCTIISARGPAMAQAVHLSMVRHSSSLPENCSTFSYKRQDSLLRPAPGIRSLPGPHPAYATSVYKYQDLGSTLSDSLTEKSGLPWKKLEN